MYLRQASRQNGEQNGEQNDEQNGEQGDKQNDEQNGEQDGEQSGEQVGESVRIDKQSEINLIIRSYFTASGKATGKVRYYFRVNADQPILQRFALRRAARTLRSQQGANPKGLSDVGTSEN